MSQLVRIYCDANCRIDAIRFDLSCIGSAADLERHREVLSEGLRVVFYELNDWEAEGTIHFDAARAKWFGIPDFTTLRPLTE